MSKVSLAGYVSPNGPLVRGSTENPVAVATARQQWLEERRHLPRALRGGTDAMRAAGHKYLPQHAAESDESYQVRINSTTLYGAFSQTVIRQAGKLFTKPVTLTDADQPILDFTNDVDGEGRSLTSFGNDAVREGFVDGIVYVFVDFPTMPEGSTQADVIARQARPYWVLIRAGQVLGWRSRNMGGQQTLEQFRFREEVEERVDEFTTEIVQQIRVLDVGGFYRLYRKLKDSKEKEDWRIYEAGRASWIDIPVVPIYVNRCGYFEGLPPLRELAELNQEHWISSSEQRRALSFGRFGMLKIIGRPPIKGPAKKGIEIAPDSVIDLPLGGDAGYVESSGAGIASGLNDLLSIEKRMQSTGMQVQVENAGQVTATAVAVDSAEGNAALKAVAKGVETAINGLLLITGGWLRVSKVGVAKVFDEFAETSSGETADILALYSSGLLSRETAWDELVRRHVLDDDFEPDDEKIRIDNEAQTLQRMANDQARAAAMGIQPEIPAAAQPQAPA